MCGGVGTGVGSLRCHALPARLEGPGRCDGGTAPSLHSGLVPGRQREGASRPPGSGTPGRRAPAGRAPAPAPAPPRFLSQTPTPVLGTLKTPALQLRVRPGPKPLKQQPLWTPSAVWPRPPGGPGLPSGGQDGGGLAAASGLLLHLQRVNKGSTVSSTSLSRGAVTAGGSALDRPHGAHPGPGGLLCERGHPAGSGGNVTDRVSRGSLLECHACFFNA